MTRTQANSRTAARSKTPPRRPGRPPRAAVVPLLSREAIIARAAEIARAEPLVDLSMVRLAREFGVTPALIHYYAGSRADLISGVINRYFQDRIARLVPRTGDWRADIEAFARTSYAHMTEHGGVLRYIGAYNRNRLFQKTAPGETDYGLEFFDTVARIFLDGGFSAEQAALGYHLLMQHIVSAGLARIQRQLPRHHESYVRAQLEAAPKARYPGARALARSFSRLDDDTAFDAGLAILLDGFSAWLKRKS